MAELSGIQSSDINKLAMKMKKSNKIQELKDKIALIGNLRKILDSMNAKGNKASRNTTNGESTQGQMPLPMNPVQSIRRDGPNVHLVMKNSVGYPFLGSTANQKWHVSGSGAPARSTTTPPTMKPNSNYLPSANLKKPVEKVRRFESKKGVVLFPDSTNPPNFHNNSFGAPIPGIRKMPQNLNSIRKFGFKRPLTSSPYPLFMQVQKRRRKPSELTEKERWYCKYGCGKFYRRTSSRSIAEHSMRCHKRPADADSTGSSKDTKGKGIINGSSVSVSKSTNNPTECSSADARGTNSTSSLGSSLKTLQKEDTDDSKDSCAQNPQKRCKRPELEEPSNSKVTQTNLDTKGDSSHDKMLEDWFSFSDVISASTKDSCKTPLFAPLPQVEVQAKDSNGDDLLNLDPCSVDSKRLDELDFQGLTNIENDLSNNSDDWLV